MLSKKIMTWIGTGLLCAAIPAVGATVSGHSSLLRTTHTPTALSATHTDKPVAHKAAVKHSKAKHHKKASHSVKHATASNKTHSTGGHGVTSMHSGHRMATRH